MQQDRKSHICDLKLYEVNSNINEHHCIHWLLLKSDSMPRESKLPEEERFNGMHINPMVDYNHWDFLGSVGVISCLVCNKPVILCAHNKPQYEVVSISGNLNTTPTDASLGYLKGFGERENLCKCSKQYVRCPLVSKGFKQCDLIQNSKDGTTEKYVKEETILELLVWTQYGCLVEYEEKADINTSKEFLMLVIDLPINVHLEGSSCRKGLLSRKTLAGSL
ncbi:hypothetical protein CDL15_Pgr022393 [Punica granatum]|uniref:Uncharacterized protein n=1 Tax=Punica granatum TaxID=22663 RepID=A0A218XRJ1_PUNGR|nr:hypothetical protein CDL15_Pgr022393 [Punica granatum]